MSSNNEIRINDIRFPCPLLCRPAVAIAPWSPTDVIVVFVLSLPLSMADFTPGKQTLLRQAISRAAVMPLSKVLVNKFQPVARRRFQVGIPHTPHTGGLMSSLESGVGRRLLADYIKVDVQMAAADTNDTQAHSEKDQSRAAQRRAASGTSSCLCASLLYPTFLHSASSGYFT